MLVSVKDLEPNLKQQVVELCQKGVERADIERYEASNRSYSRVFELLPEPKSEWKAYAWLQASRGDNYFELKDYAEALPLFREAFGLDQEYQANGYLNLRMGQCLFELKQRAEAEQQLRLAHDLGGDELFEDEYAIYKKVAKGV